MEFPFSTFWHRLQREKGKVFVVIGVGVFVHMCMVDVEVRGELWLFCQELSTLAFFPLLLHLFCVGEWVGFHTPQSTCRIMCRGWFSLFFFTV